MQWVGPFMVVLSIIAALSLFLPIDKFMKKYGKKNNFLERKGISYIMVMNITDYNTDYKKDYAYTMGVQDPMLKITFIGKFGGMLTASQGLIPYANLTIIVPDKVVTFQQSKVEVTAISKLGELELPFYGNEMECTKEKEKITNIFRGFSFQDLVNIGLGSVKTKVDLVYTINLF